MFLDNMCSQLTYKGLFNLASLPTQSAGFSISTSEPIVYPPPPPPAVAEPIPPTQPKSFTLFHNSHLAAPYQHASRHNLNLSATDRLCQTGIAQNSSPFGCLAQPSVLLLHYLYCTDTSFGSIAMRISTDDKILHLLNKVTQYSYSLCIMVLVICYTYKAFSLITKTRSSLGQLQVHGLQK
jgi:hypothetical protein